MAKISIIIPVYNSEKFLNKCLNSIEQQTFKDFEVIAVDDCSTDNSYQILKKYAEKDSRFLIFKNSNNSGPSMCRNFALKKISGDMLFFVDSDDCLDINCLKKMYESIKNDLCDVAICDFAFFSKNPKIDTSEIKIEFLNNYSLMQEIAICDKIQNFAWGKMFKKELFDNIYFPNGRLFEDVFVIPFVLSKVKKAAYFKNNLYFYRQNENSASKNLNVNKICDFFLSMEEKAIFYQNNYPSFLKYMCPSFFELFCLTKQYKINKREIKNFISLKKIYKMAAKKATFSQKIRYLVAVL